MLVTLRGTQTPGSSCFPQRKALLPFVIAVIAAITAAYIGRCLFMQALKKEDKSRENEELFLFQTLGVRQLALSPRDCSIHASIGMCPHNPPHLAPCTCQKHQQDPCIVVAVHGSITFPDVRKRLQQEQSQQLSSDVCIRIRAFKGLNPEAVFLLSQKPEQFN